MVTTTKLLSDSNIFIGSESADATALTTAVGKLNTAIAAKVADALGTSTTIAPSQHAIQAALVLKANQSDLQVLANQVAAAGGGGGTGTTLAIGPFSSANALSIPVGSNVIQTSGYGSVVGQGTALYMADATVDANYVTAHPRSSFMSSNGRGFRLITSPYITIEQLGGSPDWNGTVGTDNIPALTEAMTLQNYAPEGTDHAQTCSITFGVGSYYFGSTINLKKAVNLHGQGAGLDDFVGGTRFVFPANTSGIIVNTDGTNGLNYVPGTLRGDAAGTVIEGIRLFSQGGTDTTAAGVRPRSLTSLIRVMTENFPGNGFHLEASSGGSGSNYGNLNGWYMDSCTAKSVGGHGLYVHLSDANAGTCIRFQCRQAGLCGIYEDGTLGNNFFGIEIDDWDTKKVGGANLNGIQYLFVSNVPGLANTTTPGTNETVWKAVGTGNPGGFFPVYDNTKAYQVSMPIYSTGASTNSIYQGVYTEGGTSDLSSSAAIASGGTSGWTSGSRVIRTISTGATDALYSSTGYGAFRSLLPNDPAGTYAQSSVSTIPHGAFGAYGWIQGGVSSLDSDTLWSLFFNRYNDVICQFGAASGNAVSYRIGGKRTLSSYGRPVPRPFTFEASNGLALVDPSNANNNRVMVMGDHAPTSGTYARGEIIFNANPSAGGFAGWICTTGGSVGTVAWSGITNFNVGDLCTNGGNTYIATTGGKSANSGGPSGTGSPIADGTVIWSYQPAFVFKTWGAITA